MPERFRSKVYQQRDSLIRDIGHKSYATYLESITWGRIRERVMDRDKHKCRICSGKATAVHHLQYDRKTLLGQTLIHLIGICRHCHEGLEFKDGVKLSGEEVQKRYKDKAFRRSLRNQQRQARSTWWREKQAEETDEMNAEYRAIVAPIPLPAPTTRRRVVNRPNYAQCQITRPMATGAVDMAFPSHMSKDDYGKFMGLLDACRNLVTVCDDDSLPTEIPHGKAVNNSCSQASPAAEPWGAPFEPRVNVRKR